MIIAVLTIIGAVIGAYSAKRNAGNRLDILHRAAIYALIFAVIGSAVIIVLLKTLAPVGI